MKFARDGGILAAVLGVGLIVAQLVEPLARALDNLMI